MPQVVQTLDQHYYVQNFRISFTIPYQLGRTNGKVDRLSQRDSIEEPQLVILSIRTYYFLKWLLIQNTTFANLQELHQELSLMNHLMLRCINRIIYEIGVIRKKSPLKPIFMEDTIVPQQVGTQENKNVELSTSQSYLERHERHLRLYY